MLSATLYVTAHTVHIAMKNEKVEGNGGVVRTGNVAVVRLEPGASVGGDTAASQKEKEKCKNRKR